jgi:hypothetical protein
MASESRSHGRGLTAAVPPCGPQDADWDAASYRATKLYATVAASFGLISSLLAGSLRS